MMFKKNKNSDQGFAGGLLLGMGIMLASTDYVLSGMLISLLGTLIYLETKIDI